MTYRPSLSRRRFIGTSTIAGASLAGSLNIGIARSAFAQGTPQALGDASGSLTEWGFGIQETNPLARARILAFQAAYPDVDLEIVESYDEAKLLTAAASDTLPDLLWLGRFETAPWASRGVLQPLDEFVERDGYDLSMFYDWALEEASYDGELYGIPGGADVRALFVNQDYLDEVGANARELDTSDWDRLSELGAQLVQKSGDVIDRWGFDHKLQAGYIWLWGHGNGGNFINEDGTEVYFDDQEIVEALDWGVQAYDAQGGYTDYLTISSTWQGDEQFARGEVSMAMYEQWMLSAAVATIDPDMNFWILPIRERGSGPDGPMVTFSGGNAWYITSGAQNPDAAWEFIKFLHTVDTWMIGARAVKTLREDTNAVYFPSLTGNIEADRRQIEELYEPVNEAFDHAVELFPTLVEASTFRQIANSTVAGQLDQIMMDEGVIPALSGERSPQEALEEADAAAQEAIDFS
ncbi:MAG TPA: extracellular solute-binding protein [Thermomicrobiales bacterium]|nr:extracellular solute-binding protein [Thermomicrobiales bacterium]